MRPAVSLRMLLGALGLAAAPLHAATPVDILIRHVGERDSEGAMLVDLRLLNESEATQSVSLPDRIEARLERSGETRTIWLERARDVPGQLTVPAGGFLRAYYRFDAPRDIEAGGAKISIPAWNSLQIAIAREAPSPALRLASAKPLERTPRDVPKEAAAPVSDRSAGNHFIPNLSVYEPIYAVYGPGTDSAARIQISFKYQLFGTQREEGLPRSWRDGLHFAYTQRMFWDVAGHSSPFRNIDYQPELFYLTPSTTLSSGVSLSAQGGIRHESNGRDGDASRSINSIYFAPMAAIPLGGGYRLSIAPRLSFFVGDTSDNPDIRRYRGNGGLFMEVGEDEGLRLFASTRFNVGSGKGAVNADLSYPLPRLLGGGPDLYLFAQGFTGYGENLLDYDRRMTRLRLGVAFVR
jgi:phospholipase A1